MPLLRTGRVLTVCELERDIHEPAEFLRLIISVAGRESVSSRVWCLEGGKLTSSQLLDVVGLIGSHINDTLCLSVGVQDHLPGMEV